MWILVAVVALGAVDFGPSPIDPRSAYGMVLRGDAVLYDVREASEVADGMAGPAIWLATSRIDTDPDFLRLTLAALPRHVAAIFYCGSGKRAGLAAQRATLMGRRAFNMGGFRAWKSEGLPTKPGPFAGG